MFSPKVILWGGVASAFGGLFWILSGLAPSSAAATVELALVLGLGGLVGLYARQAGQGGKLGLAGFALGVIGTIAGLVAFWWEYSRIYSNSNYAAVSLQIERELALAAQSILFGSLALLTLGIGLVLLGVSSLRAQALHRRQTLPLVLGLLNMLWGIALWLMIYMPLSQGQNPFKPWNPVTYLPVFALSVLIGLGWIGLGTTLATQADAEISPQLPSISV